MTDDAVTVTLSLDQWRMVREALDEYRYAVEHSPGGGIRPSTRQRYAERRKRLLEEALPELERSLFEQAGLEPL